jgi:hypothetical protein
LQFDNQPIFFKILFSNYLIEQVHSTLSVFFSFYFKKEYRINKQKALREQLRHAQLSAERKEREYFARLAEVQEAMGKRRRGGGGSFWQSA